MSKRYTKNKATLALPVTDVVEPEKGIAKFRKDIYPFRISSINLRKPMGSVFMYGLLERDAERDYFWPFSRSLRHLIKDSTQNLILPPHDLSVLRLGDCSLIFPVWKFRNGSLYRLKELASGEKDFLRHEVDKSLSACTREG